MKTDLKSLLKPDFSQMSQQDRLLRCVMLAYIKHVDPDSPEASEIGYDQLCDTLCDEICNTIGSDKFTDWNESLKSQ